MSLENNNNQNFNENNNENAEQNNDLQNEESVSTSAQNNENTEAAEEKADKKPDGKKNMSKTKKTILIASLSIVALIIILISSALVFFYVNYNRMQIEDPVTDTMDLRELVLILRENLNADVSAYPQAEVDQARSAVVNERLDFLPNLDYKLIVKTLKADKNADIFALPDGEYYREVFTDEDVDLIRWAIYYNLEQVLIDIETTDEEETTDIILPPDTDKGGENETTPGVTTPEATTPEVTIPGTTPGVTTPEDTTPGVTTPVVTTPVVTTPGTTTPPPITSPVDPSVSTAVTDTEPPAITGGVVTDEDIYNILIIGADNEDGSFGGRSDTIIIASVNRVSKRIILTSIMRDTIVKDPELGGYSKINSFYARSGSIGVRAGKLINAIKHNFDIDIHDYVALNLDVFEAVIEIFGGVEVPLYYSEYLDLKNYFKNDPENKVEGLDAYYTDKKNGYIIVTLNPEQASRYARMRSNLWNPVSQVYQRSDDSFRTERQRNVIKGLMQKVRKLSFEQLTEICNKVLPQVATSLDANEFLAKLTQYMDFYKYSIDNLNLSYTSRAWYPCKTNGIKVIFHGDPGYDEMRGETGVGILEAPYRDGYALMKEAWRLKVYK